MSLFVIGVDPGVSGGIACIDADNRAWASKMPETETDLLEHLREIQALSAEHFTCCYVEQVWSRPTDGGVQAFKFGKSYGTILGILAAMSFRREFVSPQKWQTALGCRTGGDKNVSKRKAQELFPDLRITHAIADALLIAEYGRRTEGKASCTKADGSGSTCFCPFCTGGIL